MPTTNCGWTPRDRSNPTSSKYFVREDNHSPVQDVLSGEYFEVCFKVPAQCLPSEIKLLRMKASHQEMGPIMSPNCLGELLHGTVTGRFREAKRQGLLDRLYFFALLTSPNIKKCGGCRKQEVSSGSRSWIYKFLKNRICIGSWWDPVISTPIWPTPHQESIHLIDCSEQGSPQPEQGRMPETSKNAQFCRINVPNVHLVSWVIRVFDNSVKADRNHLVN